MKMLERCLAKRNCFVDIQHGDCLLWVASGNQFILIKQQRKIIEVLKYWDILLTINKLSDNIPISK
jgi:hypothetical protein